MMMHTADVEKERVSANSMWERGKHACRTFQCGFRAAFTMLVTAKPTSGGVGDG